MKNSQRCEKMAQLQLIGKIEYITLVINQFLSYIIKLYLTSNNQQNLYPIFKKQGNLKKNINPVNNKLVVNFSIRFDKIQELIELISNDKEALDMVKTIHFLDTFLFSYNVCKSVNINANFPKPGYNIDDFKAGAIVAIEFYILLQNFKASNKIDVMKAYSF